MIIDFHCHAFPDQVAPKVLDQLVERYGYPPLCDGTLTGLQGQLHAAGIDLGVVHTAATRPDQVHAANSWALKMTAQPGMVALGTLHPHDDDLKQELTRIKQHGLHGVKLHPDFQHYYLDSPEALRMFEAIGPELVILVHVGDRKVAGRPDYSAPARLRRVLEALPGLRIVAAHLGGYQQWQEAEDELVGREVYLDTSSALSLLDPDKAVALIRAHGPERVLFGSDYPMWRPADELKALQALPLTAEEFRLISAVNAQRLLGLPSVD